MSKNQNNSGASVSLSQKIHAGILLDIPMYIHGNVGIGKTTSVHDVSKHLKMDCYPIVASRYEPTYFGGYPFVKGEDVLTSKPKFVKVLESYERPVILFLDEFSTTQRATQNALLTVIQEKQAGDFPINKHTRMIAAGNFVDVAGNTILSPAMANRFLHVFHKPEVDEWINSLSNDIKLDFSYSPSWKDDIVYYQSIVVDFAETYFKSNPEYFSTMPSRFESVEDYAFPTPRSLTSAAKILALCFISEPILCRELLKGMIGSTASVALIKHITSKNKLDKFTEIDVENYKFSNDPSQVTVLIRSAAMYANDERYCQKSIRLFELAYEDGFHAPLMRYAETLAKNLVNSDHPHYGAKVNKANRANFIKEIPFIVEMLTANVPD